MMSTPLAQVSELEIKERSTVDLHDTHSAPPATLVGGTTFKDPLSLVRKIKKGGDTTDIHDPLVIV